MSWVAVAGLGVSTVLAAFGGCALIFNELFSAADAASPLAQGLLLLGIGSVGVAAFASMFGLASNR